MESTPRKPRWMPPGFRRLQDFAENFRRDFDCLQQPPSRIRQESLIDFGPPNQGSSRIYESTESITVESSVTTHTNISNTVTVDGSQLESEFLLLSLHCILDGSMEILMMNGII
jgi:hypothetical protein